MLRHRTARLARAVLGCLGLVAPALVASLLALFIAPREGRLAPGPSLAIDVPVPDASIQGVLDISGWAIDTGASDGTGVDRVAIFVDGAYIREAQYGQRRPDLGAAYGPRFTASGFRASLDLDSLVGPGDHVLEARAHAAEADEWTALPRAIHLPAGPRFCVNTHLLWFDLQRAATDLDRVRANGLSATRFDVGWDSLEPTARGDWNERYLARLDNVLQLIGERGVRPIVTVLRTPEWARSGGSAMTPPDDPADFANAVATLATRYAAVPGMTYEIWNEPNSPVFWDAPGGPNAAVYTAMLRAAYASIKSVAPNATVLGGSLAFNEPDYLAAMFDAGAQGTFDGLALHPYSRGYAPDDVAIPSRSFSLAIAHAQQVLSEHGDDGTPIWITEMGWSTAQVPDSVRADYYRRAVQIVRADPRVRSFCAFELNQGDDSTGPETGLIAPNGSPTASWDAYRRAVMGE
jgi:hypothetical protein